MPYAAAINGVMGLIGNAQNYASSKKLMKRQHTYNKQYAEHVASNAMQWTAKDLEKAGFNRVLAVNNGANSTSGGGVGLPQAPDYAGSLQSAVQTYMDNKRIQNETEVADSTADLNDANATKARKESGVIDAKTNQEIKESESRIVKNKAETNEIKSEIELNKEKTFLTVEQAYKVGWEKEKLARELQLLDKDISLYEIKMILENNPMKTIGEIKNIISNKKFSNSAKKRK